MASDGGIYQVHPQSFYDSNGDGIGDLPGITAKLDYIYSIGCNAIWIDPIFESPFGDAGYDVADCYKVAPRYGSNGDLKNLCAAARQRSMQVCLDLVAGHTSITHPSVSTISTGPAGRIHLYRAPKSSDVPSLIALLWDHKCDLEF